MCAAIEYANHQGDARQAPETAPEGQGGSCMAEGNTNGWDEWGRHVLKELERLNECFEKQQKQIQSMAADIAVLKIKSGVWGFMAGGIPAVGVLIWFIVKSK